MKNLVFITILLMASYACAPQQAPEEISNQEQPGRIQLRIADNKSSDRSYARGAQRISYNNYRASEILAELSEQPVVYEAASDPFLELNYYFPDREPSAARQECIAAIVALLELQQDTIQQERLIWDLRVRADAPPPATYDDGIKIARNGNAVTMRAVSAAELRQYLQEKRRQIVLLETDFCCLDVAFQLNAPLEALQGSLAEGGVVLTERVGKVPVLRVR
ncbi:MAG TPA: hypothetical protein PKC76_10560 [Saprospiraceae bacterium]|nr:hypothetical protein [Saprospiraceae bacterium]HMP24565.1 hypothetical protein [Saprospiraceae bacterium]